MSGRRTTTKAEADGAWDRAATIPGRDLDHYRQDPYGNAMRYESRGTGSALAWDVDHRHPVADGGTNSSRNLDAVQHEQNLSKSDAYPYHPAEALGPRAAPVPDVDCRCSAVQSGELRFNPDSTVDKTCSAVRSGDVLVTQGGHVDGRSAAVRSGAVTKK
eukprot:TRINITY_DN1248_c0_g1_i2.p3 TRINITY_DN1248_c0_g1~~TRINITY_DN1248_c0_g1_i2.p3  ORF type:complete len:160 (+),score=25.38 TRINITY_DN1248_c0_g1_i2:648-1127(+)